MLDKDSQFTTSDQDLEPPQAKRPKLKDDGPNVESGPSQNISISGTTVSAGALPVSHYYLTTVRGIPDHYNSPNMAISIRGRSTKSINIRPPDPV